MGSGKPIEDKVLRNAVAALGIKEGAELARLDRKAMSAYTQRQLFECAKRLQLKGVSKFSKDELAARIARELAARLASTTKDLPARKSSETPAEADLPEAVAEATPPAGDVADSMWSHKFEVREHGTDATPTTIPWSYDYDRVTGMAVDPDVGSHGRRDRARARGAG